MSEPSRFDREFLRTALSLAGRSDVDHFLYISDDLIGPEDLRGRKVRRKLVYAVTVPKLVEELRERGYRGLIIPAYDYSRVERVKSQVVDALIQLALEIGQEGFEGHPLGTIITIGDHTNVLEKSRQLTINPFQGLSESERNVLDPKIRDAIKNFSVLDGAFVIREDGVVLAAGRYLSSVDEAVKIPLGLGA